MFSYYKSLCEIIEMKLSFQRHKKQCISVRTQKTDIQLTAVKFHLPLRYLSPLFVLIASRPIFRLLLTLCMMVFVAQLSVPIPTLTFSLFFLNQLIKSRWNSVDFYTRLTYQFKFEEYDFCHVTNYLCLFSQLWYIIDGFSAVKKRSEKEKQSYKMLVIACDSNVCNKLLFGWSFFLHFSLLFRFVLCL